MKTNLLMEARGHGLRSGMAATLVAILIGGAGLGAPPVRAQSVAVPTALAATASNNNYLLQPNDLLEILVFQEDDMNRRLRVAKDGSVNLPLIGTVQAGRRTADELAAAVRAQLADGYLANPQVTVTVLAYAKRRFTILGQVNRPGSYDMPDNTTVSLVQAVGMAGGFTRMAAPKSVLLKRRDLNSGQEVVQQLNVERMARDASAPSLEVLPGDTITVRESMF